MLILETGTGLANSNSYASVDEANSYWQSHMGGDFWLTTSGCPMSDEDKERALITATDLLDELCWEGCECSSSQALAFPRKGLDKCRKTCSSTCELPKEIRTATIKLALSLANSEVKVNTNAADLPVKKVKAGDVETEYFEHSGINFNGKCGQANSADRYAVIRQLIKCFLKGKSPVAGTLNLCRA